MFHVEHSVAKRTPRAVKPPSAQSDLILTFHVKPLPCTQNIEENHKKGKNIPRKDAKWQRRQVSKANSQYETIGAGDNQMVTTKLETISLETVAPLHLGVFALKVF